MNFNNLVKAILDSKGLGWAELNANLAVLDSTLQSYSNGNAGVVDVFLATADVLVATAGLLGADTLPGVVFNLESIKRNYEKYKREKEAGVVGNDTIAALVASSAALVNDITDALKTRHPGFAAAAVISSIITTVAKYISVNASTAAQITEQLRQEQQGMIDIIQNQLSSRKQTVLDQYEALVRQEAALAGVDPAMAIDSQFASDVNGLINDLNNEINYKIQQSLELRIDLSHAEIEELKDQYIGEFNTILGGYGDGGRVTELLNTFLGISVKNSRTKIINQAESDFAAELNGQGDVRQKTSEFTDLVRQAFGQANIKNGNADNYVNQWLARYEGALSGTKSRILSELSTFKAQVLNGGILLVEEINEDLVGQYMTKQNELNSDYLSAETIASEEQLALMYVELGGLVVDDKKRYMSSIWSMHKDSAEALRHKAQRLAAQADMQEGVDVPDSLFNQLGELYSEINGHIELSQSAVSNVLGNYLENLSSFGTFISNTNAYIEAEINRLDAGFSNIIALLQDIISQLESLLEQPPEEEPDEDGDGIPDDEDPDADGNGIPDSEEDPNNPSEKDSDGDGIPDHLDPDRDGDGIPNEDDPTPDGGSDGGDGGTPGDPAEEGSNNANRRRRIDPLILDLDGDGLEFISLDQSQAKFDLTGDGFATHTSWVKGDDGFLALDKNGDGKINDITELFGSEDVTGFEELSALDSNGDGVINAQDAAFNDLLIWQDLNGDGHSSANEISRLSDFGITEISLTRSAVGSESNDVILDEIGSYVRTDANGNQTSHILGDVQFTIRATYSEFVGEVTLTPEAIATGKVKGYGLMPDLDIAMSLDSEFSQVVMDTLTGLTSENIFERFDAMLISWANAEALTLEDIDSTPNLSVGEDGKVHFARAGVSLSLAQLGVIKAYTGIDNLELNDGEWAGNGGMQYTGRLYEQAWNNIRSNLLVKFAVSQGLTKDILYTLDYDSTTDQLHVPFDMSVSTERMFELALHKQGALDSGKKAADLLLLASILNQFDNDFSSNASGLIIEALGKASGEALTWLAANNTVVSSLVSGVIFGSTVNATNGNELIFGTDLADQINSGEGADIVRAGDGDDVITSGSGASKLYGEGGNDTIKGGNGNDILDGGAGDDTLVARYGHNTLIGGEGNDTLLLDRGYGSSSAYDDYKNTFQGGKGNDTLQGHYGQDSYVFNIGDGQDIINDIGGSDKLVFGEGISEANITITRSSNGHILVYILDAQGNRTGDQLTLENAFSNTQYRIERIEFADGSSMDWDAIYTAALVVEGTAGDDSLTGTGHNDTLRGLAGDDSLAGYNGNDILDGGAGDDTLVARYGHNTLIGGEGNDTLLLDRGYGSSSAYDDYKNTFQGGKGNDILQGHYGQDSYVFNIGDGQDIINDIGGSDKLVFGEGITKANITITRSSNGHILVYILDGDGNRTGDQLTLENAFSNTQYRIERMEFADGSSMDWDAIYAAALVVEGTSGDDSLTGTGHNDTLRGLAGNDSLAGYNGNDILDGGAGDDTLVARYGHNTLIGGEGNDTLLLDRGYGSSSAYDDYKNTFQGGKGNDILQGHYGQDSYVFNIGDGQDTINDIGGSDKLVFGEGITKANITITRSSNGHILVYILDGDGNRTGDQLTLENAFSNTQYRIERIEFADGSSMDWDAIYAAALVVEGTSGDDSLTGTGHNDTLRGLAGNDSLAGYNGNDILDGGAGDDTLVARYGHNTLIGGEGNDTLLLDRGYGSSSAYDDYKNTFQGGKGNDILQGHYGQDSYVFNIGDGQDTINDIGGSDKLVFGEGITKANITITRSSNGHILVYILDGDGNRTGDQLTLENAFSNTQYRIERIEFADGSSMDWDAIYAAALVVEGTSGDDSLTGTGHNDTLRGLAGNDSLAGYNGNDILDGGAGDDTLVARYGHNTLIGGEGNDTLLLDRGYGSSSAYDDYQNTFQGGKGNDILQGHYGQDSYVFNIGDGQDTINDIGGSDKLVFGEGITKANITITRSSNGHILVYILDGDGNRTGDQLTLENAFSNTQYRIERIEFADGSSMDWDAIYAAALVVEGTSGDDSLTGTGHNDTLRGLAGNDSLAGYNGNDILDGGAGDDTLVARYGHNTLIGGEGNDTLLLDRGYGSSSAYDDYKNTFQGGKGNDILQGHYGQDSYVFNIGDGQDTINDIGGSDKLVFGEGITKANITITRSSNGHILVYILDAQGNRTGDQLTLENAFSNAQYRIERIEFADGSSMDWDAIYAAALVVEGTAGDDSLTGTGHNDTLRGLAGNDSLAGYNGNDILDGGAGDDTLVARYGHNTLIGGEGNDTLSLDRGYGSSSAYDDYQNTFQGGKGNDTLQGHYGQDSYVFNIGDGQDIINDIGGSDKLVFGEGITKANITITRSSNGHILVYILDGDGNRTGDQLTLENAFSNTQYRIERIEFANGSSMDWDAIYAAALVVEGTENNDSLTGTGHNDTLRGLAGDDSLAGYNGNDILDGGAGDDTIVARYGHNTLIGGEGNDTLSLDRGYGSASAYDDYQNTFQGGKGNDTLQGHYGQDSYVFNIGDGQDIINDIGGSDKLVFGEGITKANITITRSSNGHILVYILDGDGNRTGDQLTLENAFSNTQYRIERIEFADGSSMDWDAIYTAALVVGGTENNDSLTGTGHNDTLRGLAGNDSLAGYNGNDILDGGAGDDTLVTRYGHNTLIGGEGNDTLSLDRGYGSASAYDDYKNTFQGGKGNDILQGHYGQDSYVFNIGDGQDIINDIGGSDKLVFGEGITKANITITRSSNGHILVYILDRDGNRTGDQLTLENAFSNTQYRIERIEFADGSSMDWDAIYTAALVVEGTENNDSLTGTGHNDTLRGLAGDDSLAGYNGNDTLDGGAGDDTLVARYGHNTLIGGEGNDTLSLDRGYGSSSAYDDYKNTFQGGKGNDTLQGHYGQDSYVFNIGDGQDIINDIGGSDKLVFGEGITKANITITRSSNGHILVYILDAQGNRTGDQLTLENAFSNTQYRIERIEFADGSSMDWDAIYTAALVVEGTENNDSLTGTGHNDTLRGLAGDDSLAGYNGNDTLDGGAGDDTLVARYGHNTLIGGEGNDTLSLDRGYGSSSAYDDYQNTFQGGKGNDTLQGHYGQDSYVFNIGDGQDIINDIGGSDKLVFGDGITVDMISTIVEGSNLVVIIGDINSGDSIVIENASSSSHRIESVEFSDGKVISIGELPAHTPTEVSSEALLVQAMSAFEHGDVNIVGNTELTPYQGLAQIVASDILIK